MPSGQYTLEFDFLNRLSGNVPNLTFPDAFFASLYFANDLNQFDLTNGVFDDAQALFDLDYSGVANNQGLLSTSGKGGDWQHFSMVFTNLYNFVIPVFELFGLNGMDGDSLVSIDNVTLNASTPPSHAVPEPTSLLLWLVGIPLLRKQSRRTSI